MSLKYKVLSIFLVLILVILSVGISGLLSKRDSEQAFDVINHRIVPRVVNLGHLEATTLEVLTESVSIGLYHSLHQSTVSAGEAEELNELKEALEKLDRLLAQLKVLSTEPGDITFYLELEKEIEKLKSASQDFALTRGADAFVLAEKKDRLEDVEGEILEILESEIKVEKAALIYTISSNEEQATYRTFQDGVVIFVGLIIGFIALIALGTGVGQPVRDLMAAGQRVALGNFEEPVPVRSGDEFGLLAESFNNMLVGLKRAESLKVSKRYVENILDSMAEPLLVVNLSGRITTCNQASLDISGYSEEELIGNHFSEILQVVPGSMHSFKSLKDLESLLLGPGLEMEFLTGDGVASVWLSCARMTDQHEQTTGMILILQDIRRRKQMESELAKKREWEKVTLAGISDGIITTDADGRVVSMNEAAEIVSGWSASASVGRHFNTVLQFESEQSGEKLPIDFRLLRHSPDGVGDLGRKNLRRCDGSLVPIDDRLSVLRDQDHQIVGFVFVIRDITARLHAEMQLLAEKERAEAGTRAKSNFLATMSHEIRTPMNGVIGMADLLRKSDLSPRQKEWLEVICLSSDHLLSVINDILDFSKIESGKLELENIPVELPALVEEVAMLFAHPAQSKGLYLTTDIDLDRARFAFGDPTRLRQVLGNLVGNAVKFTRRGTVTIRLGIDETKDKPLLHGTVTDSGIGISAEKISHIFEAFSQVDSSTTRNYQGTGLGLAICSRLIDLMGGQLWVDSTVGVGSAFHFTIPFRSAPLPAARYMIADQPQFVNRDALILVGEEALARSLQKVCAYWGLHCRSLTAPSDRLSAIAAATPETLVLVEEALCLADTQLLNALSTSRKGSGLVLLSTLGQIEPLSFGAEFLVANLSIPFRRHQLFQCLLAQMSRKESLVASYDSAPVVEAPSQVVHILLAEDNPINQVVAKSILADLGCHSDVAETGKQVLERVLEKHYDLILMDLHMPEMTGIEAARSLVGSFPGKDRPVIVALTAGVMQNERQECLAAGMDDFVSKPITLEKMKRVLEQWGRGRGQVQVTEPQELR